MKRKLRWPTALLVVLLALGLAALGAYRMRRVQAAVTLPSAPARKGDFLVIVRCRGELKARRSVQVTAPVSKSEIVSAIQAEESKIELGLAEGKRGVREASNQLNEVSNEAKVASLTRARDKAHDEVELFRYRLGQMEIKAPLTGLVNYLSNYSQGWINAKPFKVGDQVWPGAALVEIPDLDTLEMEGKVDEIDRGRIALDQEARVRIDSLPEITFPAKLGLISPMTVMGWEWPPTRSFRGFAKLEKSDQRLRPGMNGAMDVIVNRVPNAISIPAKALFTHQGKPIVYLAGKGGYQPVEVEVLARNPDEIAIKGIPEGSKVTLVEPEKKGRE